MLYPQTAGLLICSVFVWASSEALSTLATGNQNIYQSVATFLCNNNSAAVDYIKMSEITQLDCVSRCPTTKGCGHILFCMDSQDCYVQSDIGTGACTEECDGCICYHATGKIPYGQFHGTLTFTVVKNVALKAACQASSEYSDAYRCSKAVDGLRYDKLSSTPWASRKQGVGMWIRLEFGRLHVLTHARFVQRKNKKERSKDILLEFSDGSSQEFTLPYRDVNGLFTDDVTLVPVKTTWVNITVLTVYTTYNNGWAEIELFARVLKDP